MNEIKGPALALLSGALLGLFFFAGLWWTIRAGLRSKAPAPWFLGSLLLRTGVVIGGIYLVSHKDWRQLTACLFGFWLTRLCLMRLTRTLRSTRTPASAAKPELTRGLP